MHIQHTQIGLQSQHTRTLLETSRERLDMWTGTRGTAAPTRADATPTQTARPWLRMLPMSVLAQPAPHTSPPPAQPAPDVGRAERTHGGRDALEPRMQTLVHMIEAITGMPCDAGHLLKVGERVYNLERHYNNLNGFGEGSDQLPKRFTTEPSTMGGSKGHICELDDMLVEYYDKRGWVNGVVPESKLKELEII